MHSNLFSSLTPAWLADVSLQAALWLSLVGLIGAWPGLSAARRHFIQAGALLLLPVMLIASLCVPGWRLMESRAAHAEPPTLTASTSPSDPAPDPFAAAPMLAVSMKVEETGASWIVVLWAAGMVAGLGLLVGAAIALRRLRRDSHGAAESLAMRCFREEAADFGLTLPDDCLRVGKDCRVPMTWGLFTRKTVLLPETALDWPEERLRLVLRHELAHLARADMAVSALATLAAVLLWFHPVVWLMLRASRRSREQACDDLALRRSTQSTADFARELLAAVASLGELPRCPLLPLALAMSVSASARGLRSRLENILRGPTQREGFRRPQKIALLLPAIAIMTSVAGLTACRETVSPAAAEEKAMILVRSRVLSIPVDSAVLAKAGLVMDGKNPSLQNLGVISNERLQVLLRQLSEQKGVDLMSAPSVTTRGGQKATIEVVREFIYPTEFEPPKLIANDQLVPTTPTAFEMRPVGISLEVVSELLEDESVEMTVTPEVTEFEGFIDYGTPILQEGNAKGEKVELTKNAIKQPVFHSMKMTTSVNLKHGEAVVIGGLGNSEGVFIPHETEKDTLVAAKSSKAGRLVFFILEAEKIDSPPAAQIQKQAAKESKATAKGAGVTVTIFGFVTRQGKYDLPAGATLGDLLKSANGLSNRANTQTGEIERQGHKQPLDLQNTSAPLQDGDVVIVRERKEG